MAGLDIILQAYCIGIAAAVVMLGCVIYFEDKDGD